jgi:hypothetical protein
MGITDLRAHPGRILIVLGAPIAFASAGFLHLVADGDAPDIYTGLKGHAGLWIAIHFVQQLHIRTDDGIRQAFAADDSRSGSVQLI